MRRVALSPGAAYNYFASKEDIVAACAEISLQRNQVTFAAAAGDALPALARLVGVP